MLFLNGWRVSVVRVSVIFSVRASGDSYVELHLLSMSVSQGAFRSQAVICVRI